MIFASVRLSQRRMRLGLVIGLLLVMVGAMITPTLAQTFNSGSNGAQGAFPPIAPPGGTTDITLDLRDGTVTFLPGATALLLPNTPAGGFPDGVPLGTTIEVTAKPEFGAEVVGPVTISGLSGTVENAAASVDVNFPASGVSFLEARATFTP